MRRPLYVLAGLASLSLVGALLGAGCSGDSAVGGIGFAFNLPPIVVLSADVERGIAPLTVQFTSSGSTDDGIIVQRFWEFGDGQTSLEISPTHTYFATGQYTVRLTLTDDDAASTTRTRVISVTQAPVARIVVDRTSADAAPAVFNFDGSSSFDPDGTIDPSLGFRWDFGDGSGEVRQIVPHTYGRPGTFRVRLTVTDDTGVTAFTELIVVVGIPRPAITLRAPSAEVTNIVATAESRLWAYVDYTVEPGVPRTLRGGLDRDADPCDANATLFDATSGEQVRMLPEHSEPVTSIAFSPDGSQLASASEDRTVVVFDVSNGLNLLSFGGHTDAIRAVTYSADGTRIATGGDDAAAIVHDASTGSAVVTVSAQAAVSAVAFSADGTRLATGADLVNDPTQPAEQQATGAVWDATTGAAVSTLRGHTGRVTSIAFSDDGAQVVTGSVDRSVRLWDAASGAEIRRFDGHTNAVNGVAFFADATGAFILSGSSDLTLRVWNADTGELVRTLVGHADRVTAVAVSPDLSRFLSGSADGTLRIWNRADGALLRTLSSCVSTVSSVTFSPDGRLVAGGIAAQNSTQLDDAEIPNGNDQNLNVPLGLGLTGVSPGDYRLWVELDTDRTDPVRAYSPALVRIIQPFTTIIEDDTPEIPFGDDNTAVVLVKPTAARQIFSLGQLAAGDQLDISLLGEPGYDRVFGRRAPYSVLILDDSRNVADPTILQPEMFAWFRDGRTLFDRNGQYIIGHDATYYVVIDGVADQFSRANGPSVYVRTVPDAGIQLRAQTILLDFRGGTDISAGDLPTQTILDFDDIDWGPDETGTIKARIASTIRDVFVNDVGLPFNVTVATSDDAELPRPPYLTVYFGGAAPPFNDEPQTFGRADFRDPRNNTQAGAALVFRTGAPFNLTADQVGVLLGNRAAHLCGLCMGLRETTGGGDVMDPQTVNNQATGTPLFLATSPLRASLGDILLQYNDQIGFQNARRTMEELIGLAP